MIALRGLTVRYPRSARPAVDDVTFGVAPGEVFGFIGPNGAGKTTTLRVLAGLLAPDAGDVRVAGVDVLATPDAARARVGFLADDFGVPESLTCAEYLELFAALQGVAVAIRRKAIGEALELVDLTSQAAVPAESLSRGMRQRLGLARVLLHEPDVLLLDEPASGLDPRARVEIREVLVELGRIGRTVLVSSHVLADLALACTSIGIVERGRLVFGGTVDDALGRAAHLVEGVVLVAVVEGPGRLREALQAALPAATSIAGIEDALLRVTLPPGTEDPAALVGRAATEAGLTPCHLEREAVDLEHAFLALTEGRVA